MSGRIVAVLDRIEAEQREPTLPKQTRALGPRKFISKIHEARRALWREVAKIKVERNGGRKMIRGMIVAVMLVGLSSSADAMSLIFKNYKAAKNEDEKALMKLYLDGVREGVSIFDAELAVEGRQPLFCMPNNLALTVEQAEDIMMREAEKNTDPDNVPVSLLLVE